MAQSLLAACETKPQPLTHDAYIWQRQWTPSLLNAMREAQPMIRAWRILGAQASDRGRLVRTNVDLEAVERLGKPAVLVVRIEGQLEGWESRVVVEMSLGLLKDWRQAGIYVNGLEIDHDCATSRLPRYTRLLEELRAALRGSGVEISITALPAWLDDKSFRKLILTVDELVLQTHSILSPRQGLFDSTLAERWVARLSSLRPQRFRIALPTYGHRVSYDSNGGVLAVESESDLGVQGYSSREYYSNPGEVSEFLSTLAQNPTPGLTGIAWFRLPTATDRRAWTMSTWSAVIEAREVEPQIVVRVRSTATPDAFDVVVANVGSVDAELPRRLIVSKDSACRAADGLANYDLRRTAAELRFELVQPDLIRAKSERLVGWIRCSQDEVSIIAQN